MMRNTIFFLPLIGVLLMIPVLGLTQTGLVVQIDSASVTPSCGDLFGAPESMWGVNINGEGYQYYPQNGTCFTPLPNPQFLTSANCPGDLPASVEICFQGFENDPVLPAPISCEINPDCQETICQDFTIPAVGQTQSLSLDLGTGGTVSGTLYFTVRVDAISPVATNDLPCNAIDLGQLDFNSALGNLNTPIYNNYCATNNQEPSPSTANAPGTFLNDQGVWFTFETGAAPSGIVVVDVKSDPLLSGDEFDAQVAVYEFSGGLCDGTPTLVRSVSDNSQFNARLKLKCPKPNTRYYVLVDGGNFGNESIEGPFGIRVFDPGVTEGGDLRCEFEDLGVVPENGIVFTDGFRSNFCGTPVQDPFVSAFVSQHSVWFSFIAPSSGHVYIEALSDQLIEPLDAQLAIYSAFNNRCNGGLRHLKSQYIAGNPDEMMEVSCLFGGDRYFVLVDGSGSQAKGIFQLSVSDAGDITPMEVIDTILCAGERLTVGPNTYMTSGNYIDTLKVKDGCDSIVFTNLTVAEPLIVTFEQTRFAFGEGSADAEARITVSGGLGTPQITWCDGQTGASVTGLVGGSQCCISVVDSIGCTYNECFEIAYKDGVTPIYRDTFVACKGDENGVITISAALGLPPYIYSWENEDGSLSGNGSIDADFQEIRIADLPAGSYTFNMFDTFRDTTFTVQISEPPRLVGQLFEQRNITCTGACDGSIAMDISGGTLPYDLQWSNGAAGTLGLDRLCPGEYTLTVVDARGCQISLSASLEEPLPFLASAELVKDVSCFQASDGQVGVDVENGTAAEYRWSNGATTQVVNDLTAGFYQVTVTSDLFCEAVAEVEVTQPDGPLELDIEAITEVSCAGEADGLLQALVAGPYTDLSYQWSNGSTDALADRLSTGWYRLEVRNERGCTSMDSFLLEEPTLIEASLQTRDITCLDPVASGAVFIDEVSGGAGNYRYSIDEQNFTGNPVIKDLTGGPYVLTVQDENGCTQAFDFNIQTPPEFNVSLGEEIIQLDLGDSLELFAFANSNNVSYRWDHDANLSGPTVSVAPQISTYYRVKAEDTQTFCQSEAVVFIQVNKDRRVYIPNAFSPNLDGNNDYFFIYGDNDIVQIESLRIFNREGHLIFQDNRFMPNDPLHAWDGSFQGQQLNSGVFVYVAEITFVDGLTEVFKGDVALVR